MNDKRLPKCETPFGFRHSYLVRHSSFGFRHSNWKKVKIPATRKMFTKAISKKNNHPNRISWSQRNRGNVQRIHIMKKIRAQTFVKKTAMLSTPKIQPCEPSGIPGKCQPPRKSVVMRQEPVIIAIYSP